MEIAGKPFQPAAFPVDMEQRLVVGFSSSTSYMKQGIRIADDEVIGVFSSWVRLLQEAASCQETCSSCVTCLFYPDRHPVKGTCHLSDFIMGIYPGAPVKNALADIGGGLLQLPQTRILLVRGGK